MEDKDQEKKSISNKRMTQLNKICANIALIMTSLGRLMIGIAAIYGVWQAGPIADKVISFQTNVTQSQSNRQVVVCNLSGFYNTIKKLSKNINEETIKALPNSPVYDKDGQVMPFLKDDDKKNILLLKNPNTEEEKSRLIIKYFDNSLKSLRN